MLSLKKSSPVLGGKLFHSRAVHSGRTQLNSTEQWSAVREVNQLRDADAREQ